MLSYSLSWSCNCCMFCLCIDQSGRSTCYYCHRSWRCSTAARYHFLQVVQYVLVVEEMKVKADCTYHFCPQMF